MSTELDALPTTQVHKLIADRLRAAILENEIKPGDWIRQEQIAQKYHVSFTPVREAFKDLVAEGLFESVPYRGVRLVEYSLQDILDLYACRATMESLAARFAAQNVTAEELADIEKTFHGLEENPIDQKIDQHRQLHRQFHRLIYSASRHTYLIHALDQLWTTFPTMMLSHFERTARQPIGRGAAAMKEHGQILNALKKHDSRAAERLMKKHIQATAASIAAVLKTPKRKIPSVTLRKSNVARKRKGATQ